MVSSRVNEGGLLKWMVAAKQETDGFRWHAKYSIEATEVLGRLACLMLRLFGLAQQIGIEST